MVWWLLTPIFMWLPWFPYLSWHDSRAYPTSLLFQTEYAGEQIYAISTLWYLHPKQWHLLIQKIFEWSHHFGGPGDERVNRAQHLSSTRGFAVSLHSNRSLFKTVTTLTFSLAPWKTGPVIPPGNSDRLLFPHSLTVLRSVLTHLGSHTCAHVGYASDDPMFEELGWRGGDWTASIGFHLRIVTDWIKLLQSWPQFLIMKKKEKKTWMWISSLQHDENWVIKETPWNSKCVTNSQWLLVVAII